MGRPPYDRLEQDLERDRELGGITEPSLANRLERVVAGRGPPERAGGEHAIRVAMGRHESTLAAAVRRREQQRISPATERNRSERRYLMPMTIAWLKAG